jgi:hypothetical protein
VAIVAYTANEKDPDQQLYNADSGVYLQIMAISDVYPGHAVIGTIIPSKSDYNTNDYAANTLEARYIPAPHCRIDELVNDLKGGISGFDTLSPSRGQFTEVTDSSGSSIGYRLELKYAPANVELENMMVFANGVYQAPGTGYSYESGGTFVQKSNQDFPIYLNSIAEDSVSYVVSPDIVFQTTYGFSAAGSTEISIPPTWRDDVAAGRVGVVVYANGLILDPEYYEYSGNRQKIIIKAPYDQVSSHSEPYADITTMLDEEEAPISSITLIGVRGLIGISKVAQGYASVPVTDVNGNKVLKNQNFSTSFPGQSGYHAEKGGGLGPWANVPKIGLPLSAPGSVPGQNESYPKQDVVHALATDAQKLDLYHFENDGIVIGDWPTGSIHTRIPFFSNTGSIQVFVDGRMAHANHPITDEIVAWEFKGFNWPRGYYVRERNSNFLDISTRPLKGTFVNYFDYKDDDDTQLPKQEWDALLESYLWDATGDMKGGHALANKIIVLHFDNAAARSNIFIENQQVPNSLCASAEFANTSACKAFLDINRIRIDGTPATTAVASPDEFPVDTGEWNVYMTRAALTGEAPAEMSSTLDPASLSHATIANTIWATSGADYLDAVATVFSFAQAAKNAGRMHYDPSPPSGFKGVLSDGNQLVGNTDVPINSSGQQIGFMGGNSKTQYGEGDTNASIIQSGILTNAEGFSSENFFGPNNPLMSLGGLDNYMTPLIKSMGFDNRFLSTKFGLDTDGKLDFSKILESWGKWVGGTDIPDSYNLLEVLNALYNKSGTGTVRKLAMIYGGIHTERDDAGTTSKHPANQGHKRYKDGHMYISLETGCVKIPSHYGGYGYISGHINFDKPDTSGLPADYINPDEGDGISNTNVRFGGFTHNTFATSYSSGAPVQQHKGMAVAYKATPLMAFVSPAVTTAWPWFWEHWGRPQAFPAPIWRFTLTTFKTNEKELALRVDAKHVPGVIDANDWCISYPIFFMVLGSSTDPRYMKNNDYPYVFTFKKSKGGKDVISPDDTIVS